MSKQTAVEWFNDEIIIHLNFDQRLYLKDIFKQALKMEKEQHEMTFNEALNEDSSRWFEKYYNETFKNQTK